jgi:5-methylcytosine-specific restriction endonuclease McrA
MHLLAYWRLDNYLRDLDEGAGFNFNSRQSRLHSAIGPGETLWLFTVVKNPPRFFVVARLVVRSKTMNPPGFKYGDYRVWGDLNRSRYFQLRVEERADEAFELLRRLPLVSGTLEASTRFNLPQACQTIRGLTQEANDLLEEFTRNLPDEERAWQVANEYELERELLVGDTALEKVLRRDHTGPSEERRLHLLSHAARDRQLVKDLHDRYSGRCQLCAFDSPVVYGIPSDESHHIVYLSRGGEDTLLNMVLLCPNHHTVVHKTEATFDYLRLSFCFPNGRVEPLCLNTHLVPHSETEKANPSVSQKDTYGDSRDNALLTKLIVSQLTPDLLTAEWAASRREGDHPLKGYCYVASEALYHLAGGASSGLSVYRCSLPVGGSHWWLADPNGRILDLTAAQFSSPPPYAQGVRTSFLSRKPSSRAAKLIAKVRAQLRQVQSAPM